MFANIFITHIQVILTYFIIHYSRLKDRSFHLNNYSLTKKKIQIELEKLYIGPEIKLEQRYASLLVSFYVCIIFSSGIPALWIVLALTFIVIFLIDKWALLRLYCSPPK